MTPEQRQALQKLADGPLLNSHCKNRISFRQLRERNPPKTVAIVYRGDPIPFNDDIPF